MHRSERAPLRVRGTVDLHIPVNTGGALLELINRCKHTPAYGIHSNMRPRAHTNVLMLISRTHTHMCPHTHTHGVLICQSVHHATSASHIGVDIHPVRPTHAPLLGSGTDRHACAARRHGDNFPSSLFWGHLLCSASLLHLHPLNLPFSLLCHWWACRAAVWLMRSITETSKTSTTLVAISFNRDWERTLTTVRILMRDWVPKRPGKLVTHYAVREKHQFISSSVK